MALNIPNPVPTAAARVAKGTNASFKRQIRMQRAINLEKALYKDAEIAVFLGITPAGLAQMKADPEYVLLRMQAMSGVITEAEELYLKEAEYKHDQLRALVPQALQNLFDLARSQNEHVKLKATSEILDREGTLAKVSRIGLATADQGGAGTVIDDEIANNLLNIQKIQTERAAQSAKAAETIAKNESTTIQ